LFMYELNASFVTSLGTFLHVLGQRSLLGFGVVVAWLLLFHLLVNIWLLCVFTSLLVVLGGWLGSQAVLESNSLVHLERFITLEQVPPSVEDEHHLDQEIHNTVRKIIRDFVTSWYSTVSSESGFETEVQEAMVSMAMELKLRARKVDRKELTQRILDLCGSHLQDYIRAKELVTEQQNSLTSGPNHECDRLWEAYSNITPPHLATTNDSIEVNYVRAVVDLLLHVLVPLPHLETRTGRFVVVELITCNVLLPLIDKLSDPDWLNLLMIEIFGKTSKPQETGSSEPSTASPSLSPPSPDQASLQLVASVPQSSDVPPQRPDTEAISHIEMAMPALAAYDATDSEEVDFPANNAEEDETTRPFLRHFMRGRKSNPFYQEYDSDLDSPLADDKRSSIDSLVMIGQEEGPYDKQKECSTSLESNNELDLEDVCSSPVDGSCPKVVVNSDQGVHPNGCSSASLSSAEAPPITNSLQDVEREGGSSALNPNRELLLGIDQTGMGNPNELTVVSPVQGCSPMGTFSFEPLSSPEGPVIIQNLRITGTITAKEHRGTGSHPYTLYTIKYETAMGCENPGNNPSSIQPVAYHMVNRRYSEFLNLQTRLEEKAELRKLVKGVKGPKKMFPDMPFGNMDSDKIEARKGLLETFLKQLCTIAEIANSEEMQEFLALNTDARIAFVKKPFIVSRIDKIVVNAIVDTLKTAFPRSEPQSPTEDEGDVDGGKMSLDKKSKSRLKFPSKNVPFMNGSDMKPQVLFSWDQTNMVSDFFFNNGCHFSMQSSSETALAEVALNILCLLMKEQWSWLCTENIQKTIRLLFGTLINRWLDVSVANLTSPRYWAAYLQVIQEAVWPGGSLPVLPRPQRSQQQRDDTRQQALRCLMRLLPDLVSDLLGSDKYRFSWQTALDSFQDPHINRNLVYCIFDLLLEVLVPEIPEEDFQRSVLQTLSKNPEKLLA
uniref:Sorting nexin 19b n=1 Tax=Salarias fasciatus TaxID=181472 RepID=A0A672I879_SALFA